jgi:hypothetical protein
MTGGEEPDVRPPDDDRAGDPAPPEVPSEDASRARRPLVERLGLAAIAAFIAILFGGVALAAWIGGEVFLAVMGGIGCVMTAWVGGLTLFRG